MRVPLAIPDLAVETVRALLSYDPDAGLLHWKVTRKTRKAGTQAGGVTKRGYVLISILGRLHPAHRVAWLLAHGEWPTLFIDHIDGNRSNNKLENLRLATHQENLRNSDKRKGYCRDGTGWFFARITVDGRSKYISRHKTQAEAHAAYLEATRIHFGEFSVTNRPQFAVTDPARAT